MLISSPLAPFAAHSSDPLRREAESTASAAGRAFRRLSAGSAEIYLDLSSLDLEEIADAPADQTDYKTTR